MLRITNPVHPSIDVHETCIILIKETDKRGSPRRRAVKMRRKIIFLFVMIVLIMPVLTVAALAVEIGTYTWQNHVVEVTDVDISGKEYPSNMRDDEYCVAVIMTVDACPFLILNEKRFSVPFLPFRARL